tara:strand:+ start:838 stop:1221 length:384 start_codon:yes stop_codon:yes gene_type:complete
MGEHAATGLEKWLMDKTGKDIYFWNFIALMVLTVIEVAAVYIDWVKVFDTTLENAKLLTWAILIGVGLIKVYGIAGFFMHLKGDPFIYTKTAVFPLFFVMLMLYGIGLSNPGGVDELPSWCLPPWLK